MQLDSLAILHCGSLYALLETDAAAVAALIIAGGPATYAFMSTQPRLITRQNIGRERAASGEHSSAVILVIERWTLDIDRLRSSRQTGTTPPLPRSLVHGGAGYVCEMEINLALVNMRTGVEGGMRWEANARARRI